MAARRIVVDGSNIATEGRTLPSLRQLNEAVLAFLTEYPDAEVTVVVDATFGHRIDPAELAEFEEAEANNEVVSPPAGAIGRGDAFLLRIAGKIGATVLSNDSFQEFHGEHEWLFDDARLIGGKPVPGIGWIFTPRTPVRGVKSRKAVKDAKRKVKGVEEVPPTVSGELLGPRPVPKAPPPRRRESAAATGRKDAQVAEAIATATEESVAGSDGQGRKRRRKKRLGRPAEPVNDALAFITFIAEHPLGSEVSGEVETFTSHGAFVLAGGARCYVPISALGEPPPRAARDVLNRGERRTFVVQALDPQRRGIELALPEFAKVAGAPLPETIEAEITEAPVDHVAPLPAGPSREPVAARVGTRLPTRGRRAPAAAEAAAPAPTAVTASAGGRKRSAGRAAVPVEPVAAAPSPAEAGAGRRTGGVSDRRAKAADRAVEVAATEAPAAAPAKAPAKRTRTRAGATAPVATAPVDTDGGVPALAGAPVVESPAPAEPVVPGAKATAKRSRKAAPARATDAGASGATTAGTAGTAAAQSPAPSSGGGAEPTEPTAPDGGGRARTPRRNPAKSAGQGPAQARPSASTSGGAEPVVASSATPDPRDGPAPDAVAATGTPLAAEPTKTQAGAGAPRRRGAAGGSRQPDVAPATPAAEAPKSSPTWRAKAPAPSGAVAPAGTGSPGGEGSVAAAEGPSPSPRPGRSAKTPPSAKAPAEAPPAAKPAKAAKATKAAKTAASPAKPPKPDKPAKAKPSKAPKRQVKN